MKYRAFRERLMRWHSFANKRQMPWKGQKDPYKVWLSEIILQQTRVEHGWSYYTKFITKYPDLRDLAEAKDEEVFKLWEGLGYYNRCKNLLFTARYISYELDGKFPTDYKGLLSLKGIGNYTASAIASFCYGLSYPVLDGNVLRVLSRIAGNDTPTDSRKGKNIFQLLAEKSLDKKNPGSYNQAIMDFGAIVCKPFMPSCSICPMQNICVAGKTGRANALPVKEKSLKRKLRWFTYFVLEFGNEIWVSKRTSKDIWQNLHEFYLLETENDPKWTADSIYTWLTEQFSLENVVIKNISPADSQQLTHQTIRGYFVKIGLLAIPRCFKNYQGNWLSARAIQKLAFPKFISQHFPNDSSFNHPKQN